LGDEALPAGTRWLTVDEVAACLRISAEWVRDQIKSGRLAAKQLHRRGRGQYRVSEIALQEFMADLPDAAELGEAAATT
jgi:excisionase family DNA binding protein